MAKYLTIDEQTLSDLAIFGRPGKTSIFELYQQTRTQGGSAKMEALFRHPLSDGTLINERAALYQFFSTGNYAFPVDVATIGSVAYYLENEDVRSQLPTGGQRLGQKLTGLVSADAGFLFVQDGVQASLNLIHTLDAFIRQMEGHVAGSAYQSAFDKLAASVQAPDLAPVRQYASSRFDVKLTMAVLANLDRIIRFTHRKHLLQLLDLLYDLDVCITVGQVARQRCFHFARAMFKDSGILHCRQVYHPQVEGAVANDLFLDKDHNILFLTGANMAGKSTLMKSIGVALFLAHMGFPVAAKQFEFAVMDGLYTSINLADNLSMGASHYYAEVLRVKEVARALSEGRQLFVIFDELFRGTNVRDANEATIVLSKAFCRQPSSRFILSTHIIEAGENLQKQSLPIRYQYLPTEMRGGTPVYTRILKEGITADRQGMVIIRNEGILEMLDAGIKS